MNVELFERLKSERKRIGFTQDQMAAAGGVAKGTYFNYESGARQPPLDFLKKLGDVGANVHYLLYGKIDGEAELLLTVIEQGQEFVFRLRELVRDKPLDEWAKELHTSKEKMLSYLNGVEYPAVDFLIAICTATRTDPGWLITGTPPLKPDEAAFLDNYRHSPKDAQESMKTMCAALAQSGVKKGRAA